MSEKFKPKKLRAKDIAKLYSVSIPTIWNYAKQGKLKATKITNQLTLFDYEEVEKFFNGGVICNK